MLLATRYSLLVARRSPLAPGDVAACLLLALLTLAFPWQLSLLGYLPNSIDFTLQYYPNLAFLGQSLKAGLFPLWNPHVFAGTPYLADPQSAALYFPNWPFLLLLDTDTAARAIVMVHYGLATLSTYGYLRTVRLGSTAALVGAILFGLSEYTITQVAGIPLLINLAWIPVALLLVEMALQRRSLGYAMGAALALTLQLFNGWVHGLYITFFALLATFLWHLLVSAMESRSWKPALSMTLPMLAAVVVWAALGAVLLLPALEFVGQSNYLLDRGLEQAGGEGNVTVLAILGVGGSEGHGAYIGALGLLLVLLGALYGRDRKRIALYLGLGAFSLLVAFGTKAPLYALLYGWLPGFKAFHTPGRFMVLYLFCASALAAMGMDTLLKGAGRKQALTVVGMALLLLGPFYYTMSRMFGPDAFGLLANNLEHWSAGPYLTPDMARQLCLSSAGGLLFLMAMGSNRLSGRRLAALALLLLVADLFLMRGLGWRYFASPPAVLHTSPSLARVAAHSSGAPSPNPAPSIDARTTGIQLTAAPDSLERDFRVMGYARNGTLHFLSDFPYNVLPDLMPPNLAMIHGLEDVQGYNPLQLRRYAEYVAAINGGPDDYHWALIYNFQSRLLDMLGVRYVALRGDDSRLKNVTIATGLNLEGTRQSVTVRPATILASGLQVQSYLGNSAEMKDGQVAARLRVTDTSGRSWSFDLRAGIETAEWAYDRPDVLQRVQHQRAKVSMTWNLPSPVHTYVADLAFPQPIDIAQVTLERVEPGIFIVVPEVAAVPARPIHRYEEVDASASALASSGSLPMSGPTPTASEGVRLFRNTLALPRALVVPRAEVVQDPAEVLRRLQSDDFDPWQKVLLEGPGAPAHQGIASGIGGAVVVSRNDNSTRLTVRADSYGFLVLNELSYPGWNAYLDGQRTRVWRANYLFRAIEIPPGEHEVEFRFEPDSLKLGLSLSLPTLALLLAAAVFHLKTRQHWKESAPR